MLKTRTQELEEENRMLRDRLGYDKADTAREATNQYGLVQGQAGRQETPQEKIDYLFTFHDDPDKAPHYVEIRESAKAFALVILRHGSAGSADQRTAIEHVRQAVMFANASVALNGRGL